MFITNNQWVVFFYRGRRRKTVREMYQKIGIYFPASYPHGDGKFELLIKRVELFYPKILPKKWTWG